MPGERYRSRRDTGAPPVLSSRSGSDRVRCTTKRKILKDVQGRILGFEDEGDDGRVYAKNVHGSLLGRYDRDRDLTLNEQGRTVTHGNSLSALIFRDHDKNPRR